MKWRSCLWVGLAVSALFGLVAVGATITVNPGQDIQAAISGAGAGDTILLAAGVHDVAVTINVSKAVTITGLGAATVRGTTSAARNVFKITASSVTLQNMDITLSATYALATLELDDALVAVPVGAGLSNVVIRGNTLHWPTQAGAMSTWGGRAITIGGTGAPGIVITGNTVYNTRNGIVVQYNNPAVITDNLVYNTKGGVMNYTNNQADADSRIIAGNTWGTAHNEWDIVWNSGGAFFTPNYVATVIDVSNANNGAYVVDRRDAANWNYATGNRSHIFVDLPGTATANETSGNMNLPYATIGLAITGVADDGTIYVSSDVYQEQVVFSTDKALIGSGSGTVIEAPTTLTQYFTTGSNKNYPVLFVQNADSASVEDLVVDGLGRGNGNYRFVGIGFYNAGGTVDSVEIRNIKDTPFSGSQHGVGFYGYNADGTPRSLVVSNSSVHDFQKNAMVFSGGGLTVDVAGNTIVGIGPTTVTAQNGIQVSGGAAATIEDNAVSGIWYTGNGWAASSILVYDAADGAMIVGNSVTGGQVGLYAMYTDNLVIERNVFQGGDYSILLYPSLNASVHYNSMSGNLTGFYTGSLADATLNWWGAADGPWADQDMDGTPDNAGSGDGAWGPVIFSPWLGTNPDGNPLLPGVQITGPALIVVDDVGPSPTGGYLNAAIAGSNSATLGYEDTIQLLDGSFTASTPITGGVTLVSQNGAGGTAISGSLLLNSANVIIGRMREGFALSGPITVGAGVDASTIHINWNDIYDVVTNGGGGWLDATYNYWGEDGPDTVGLVSVYPYLPVTTGTLIGYVDEYGYSVSDAITFATVLVDGATVSEAELILLLGSEFGLSTEEAAALIGDYGRAAVYRATLGASSLEELMLNLVGYEARIPSGGAGGGGGGDLGGYVVGSVVPLFLVLADPFTGDPIVDAMVTYSVARTLGDGMCVIERFGVMPYDAAAGGYAFALDTTGLLPGSHVVYLGMDDGRSISYTIVLTE
jgi:nitrous oxidase accessory protein NosD